MTSNKPEKYPWGDERPFNSYVRYLRKRFGYRVQKLSIDAGFTCPNRDGTKGIGGCTFCNNAAFTPPYAQQEKSITQQLQEGVDFQSKRYKTSHFFAYFQSFTNTYDSVDNLRIRFQEALAFPGIEGLIIGTRPDCIDESKLAMMKEITKGKYLAIEYGIESCDDNTLARINRGHDFATTQQAIHLTHNYGIPVGAHIIFGLPGEDRKQQLESVHHLNKLPISTLKMHQLQILKGTQLGEEYRNNPERFNLFLTLGEYVDFLMEFVTLLRPDIMIQRFAGEAQPNLAQEFYWDRKRYDQVLLLIEQTLIVRGLWQGKKF